MTRLTWTGGFLVTLVACLPIPKPPPCTSFWDQSSPGTVHFIVENQGQAPLFFTLACEETPTVVLTRADGTTVIRGFEHEPAGMPGDCATTCQDKQTNPSTCYFDAAMCQGGLLRLNPGASVTVDWQRLEVLTRSMPSFCWATNSEPSCSQVSRAPAGGYTVAATAFTLCESATSGQCECPGGAATCRLVPDAHGAPGSPTQAASSVFQVPGDGDVHVTFN